MNPDYEVSKDSYFGECWPIYTACQASFLVPFRWHTAGNAIQICGVSAASWSIRTGVTSRDIVLSHMANAQSLSFLPSGNEVTCNICFCDVSMSDATCMDCGHCFCNDCWRQHIKIQVMEGQSRRLKCMALKCGTHCDEDKASPLYAYLPGLSTFIGMTAASKILEPR